MAEGNVFHLPAKISSSGAVWGPPPVETGKNSIFESTFDREEWRRRTGQRVPLAAPITPSELVLKEAADRFSFREARNDVRETMLLLQKKKEGSIRAPRQRFDAGRGQFGGRGGRGGRGGGRFGKRGGRQPNYVVVNAQDTMHKRDDATELDTFDCHDLLKLNNVEIPSSVDLSQRGRPQNYNDVYDNVRFKTSVVLDETPGDFSRVDVIDDPVVREMIKNYEGTHPVIFTTDEILATIMTSGRSVQSWHTKLSRFGRFAFMQSTEDPPSRIGLQFVHETASREEGRRTFYDGPSEMCANEMDKMSALANESTRASQCLKRQLLGKQPMEIKTDPKPDQLKNNKSLFRYRRYTLHAGKPNQYDVVVRCEIEAAQNNEFIRIFGLLEYTGGDRERVWPEKLDTQRQAVLMPEVKANSFLIARWTCLAILSGAPRMKIGFLTRHSERRTEKITTEDKVEKSIIRTVYDNRRHNIVGVETVIALDFASQMGLIVKNMWSVANLIFERYLASVPADDSDRYDDVYIMKRADEPKLIMFVQEEEDDDDDDDDDDEDDDDDDDDEGSEESDE